MKKILLVDDQPNFTNMMAIKLKKLGHTVFTAENGQIGLDIALSEKPDIIVMDIMMPIMDGFTAAEKIKANVETRNIPIIFLSAKGQSDDKIKAKEIGAVDFFTKPFSPKALLERMLVLLG